MTSEHSGRALIGVAPEWVVEPIASQAFASEDEQRFLALVRHNPANALLIDRLPDLDAPESHVVAGCLFQTIWNCLSGKSPQADILDYDIFYYDPSDRRRALPDVYHAKAERWKACWPGLKVLPWRGDRT